MTCLPDKLAITAPAIAGAAIVGGPVGTLGGIISATLFSLPFTVAAQHTRQFKSNDEITPNANLISSFTDTQDHQYIINEIIKKDNDLGWWGIRSHESSSLMARLTNEKLTLQEKWKALTTYMNDKSNSSAYIHNGKKLFNALLSIATENEFILRKNLQLALQTNNSETTQQIITLNPELITQTDSNGMNFLHRAVVNNDVQTINTLIDTDIDLNIAIDCPSHANHGKTILDLALEHGHATAVHKLIIAGAALAQKTKHYTRFILQLKRSS